MSKIKSSGSQGIAAPVPGGELPAILLAGGRPRNPSAMARMMAGAFRGPRRPIAAYIGAANGDDPLFFEMMQALLLEAGAADVVFARLAEENPDIDAVKKALGGADVIFLAGGEVEEGINWLRKHGLALFLKELYGAGKRFMGVSAGVIMMGRHWLRWDNPDDDDTAKLFDCLGIIPAIFDVHGEDEDWAELKAALKLMGEGSRGYALPRECVISADSRGNLVNLSKKYIVFINEGGAIKRSPQ